MNDYIDDESRDALVKYRFERALKTLDEVEILLSNGLFSTAVNRLYYSVYYAAIALLIKDGFTPMSHAGVRSVLGLHYIKTGKMSRENGNNFMLLFERRHRTDYDDFIESSEDEVIQLIPLAKSFIEGEGFVRMTQNILIGIWG